MRRYHATGRPTTAELALWLLGFALFGLVRTAEAVEHDRSAGEPYALAGKRMMFTSWIHVRPGQFDWQDDGGKTVFSSKDKMRPFEAHFKTIDSPQGVRLLAEPAQRVGPIITGGEKPWETMGVWAGTLIHEDGKYRLWGGCQDSGGRRLGCYLESTDCRTWQRPTLGQVEFEGSRENNLVALNFYLTVFKDPIAAPEERYKALWHGDCDMNRFKQIKDRRPWSFPGTQFDPGRVHSIRAAVSPDGFKWTELADSVSLEPSDTHIVGYYDRLLKEYVLYTRNFMLGPEAEGFPYSESRRSAFLTRRAIGRTESRDFREFPPSEVIIETGNDMPPTDTYYTNCRTAIPGAPDHHLMFPAIYHQATDTTSIAMFTSHNGKNWSRAPGSPVLTTSEFGKWDGGCVFAVPELVELPDGDWALPYTGFIYPHKYPRGAWKYSVGLAVWPKGRVMGIVADEKGEFTTAAVVAPGQRLRINAVTERAGSILVEVADLDGKPIAGRTFAEAVPILGDQQWTPVKWKDRDDIGVEVGKPVEFRVRMDHARIYGFEFE